MAHLKGLWGELPTDLQRLALVSGLSGMALNASGVFGLLSVLAQPEGLWGGVAGAGIFMGFYATCGFIGQILVGRIGAHYGLKLRHALLAVFLTHLAGFALAVGVHPLFLGMSSGFGLGMFWITMTLTTLNKIENAARDRYTTITGAIQQSVTLLAPLTGAGALTLARIAGMDDPFTPVFIVFAACLLLALPLIMRFPMTPLQNEVLRPLRASFGREVIPIAALTFCVILCESQLGALMILLGLNFLGEPVDVAWLTVLTAVAAVISLFFSQRHRIPGRRWKVMLGAYVLMWVGCVQHLALPGLATLLLAVCVISIVSPSYFAAWYAYYLRVVEKAMAPLGKNQALTVGSVFVLAARLTLTGVMVACGTAGLGLGGALEALLAVFFVGMVGFALLGPWLEAHAA